MEREKPRKSKLRGKEKIDDLKLLRKLDKSIEKGKKRLEKKRKAKEKLLRGITVVFKKRNDKDPLL